MKKNEFITKGEMNELIKIGELYSDKSVDYIKKNIKDIKLNFDGKIQYNLHNFFLNSSRGYNKRELTYILIGAAVGEVYLRRGEVGSENGFGSVSSTQKIISILEKEEPLRAKTMKKWAKQFGFKQNWIYN